MSYAAKEARRFVLALMVAGLGILVTACDSATAPETSVAAQLRDPGVGVDGGADRGTDEAGTAASGGSQADQRPRPKYHAE